MIYLSILKKDVKIDFFLVIASWFLCRHILNVCFFMGPDFAIYNKIVVSKM